MSRPASTPQPRPVPLQPGERWTQVISPDEDGPYHALVPADPGFRPLFPRDAMDAMVADMDHAVSIHGGLRWAADGQAVLFYRDADDDDPRLVSPDARGLYDLGLDEFWVEHRVPLTVLFQPPA